MGWESRKRNRLNRLLHVTGIAFQLQRIICRKSKRENFFILFFKQSDDSTTRSFSRPQRLMGHSLVVQPCLIYCGLPDIRWLGTISYGGELSRNADNAVALGAWETRRSRQYSFSSQRKDLSQVSGAIDACTAPFCPRTEAILKMHRNWALRSKGQFPRMTYPPSKADQCAVSFVIVGVEGTAPLPFMIRTPRRMLYLD